MLSPDLTEGVVEVDAVFIDKVEDSCFGRPAGGGGGGGGGTPKVSKLTCKGFLGGGPGGGGGGGIADHSAVSPIVLPLSSVTLSLFVCCNVKSQSRSRSLLPIGQSLENCLSSVFNTQGVVSFNSMKWKVKMPTEFSLYIFFLFAQSVINLVYNLM